MRNLIKKKEYFISGISKFDENILNFDGDVLKAVNEELKTGYQNSQDCETTTEPYGSKEGEYYTIDKGQSEIIKKLSEKIDNDKIKLNHKVCDVLKEKKRYCIKVKVYSGDKKIVTKNFYCKKIISCVTKMDALYWTVCQNYMKSLLDSVTVQSLHHIYAKKTPKKLDSSKRKFPENALQQVIKPTHDKEWFQVSYSSGRISSFWNRIELKYGNEFVKKITQQYSNIPLEKVETYHWTNAYHMWVPVPEFDFEKAVGGSIEPNRIHLPDFYWAGECFSSHQGWAEGALETADMVLKCYFRNWHYFPIYKKVPSIIKEWMVLDNFILDVSKWKHVHPGSEKAITKHLSEDISKLFRYIKHTELSWAVFNSLKIGYIEKDEKNEK